MTTTDSNADEKESPETDDSTGSSSKASEEEKINSAAALPLPANTRHSSSGPTTYPYTNITTTTAAAAAAAASANTTTTNDDDNTNGDDTSKCTLGLNLSDAPGHGGAQPDSADTVVSGLTNPPFSNSENVGANDHKLPAVGASSNQPSSNLKSDGRDIKKKGGLEEEKKDRELSSEAAGDSATLYSSEEVPETKESGDTQRQDQAEPAQNTNDANSEEMVATPSLNNTPSQSTPTSRPSQSTSVSRPGAYAVYPTPSTTVVAEEATTVSGTPSVTANSMTATTANAPDYLNITEAYTVDDTPPPSATVVKTFYGVERKRFYQFVGGGLVILAVVLAIAIPLSKNSSSSDTCGPLCGEGNEVPNPDLMVLGKTCRQYDEDSTNIVAPSDSCLPTYSVAAYGCGCPSSLETAESSSVCGKLCSDGSAMPDPELEVKDYKLNSYTCRDWETLSLFESNPDECPLYNAIGRLCGCASNEPHPDSCGPLCERGEALSTGVDIDFGGDLLESIVTPNPPQVWGVTCSDWNTFSSFLPSWYNNEKGETCGEFYESIAYGCACPGTRLFAMSECGPLCQELRKCKPLCEDGSALPEESKDILVKYSTCEDWEYTARYEVHEFICPQYQQFGAMCGCDNKPHPESWSKECGMFCGERPENVPDPDMVILDKTCETWHYEATYLPFTQSDQTVDVLRSFGTCENFESIAYECGCEAPSPPEKSCGKLCRDGYVPDRKKEIWGRTCGDWDYLSMWDERMETCDAVYRGVSEVCGCTSDTIFNSCFEIEQLNSKTWFFGDFGPFQYTITFGKEGQFRQLHYSWNFEDQQYMVIGHARDEVYPNNATVEIKYYGGHLCGEHGARLGTVQFVEVENATRPEIVSITEPSTCRYLAIMNVPPFCKDGE